MAGSINAMCDVTASGLCMSHSTHWGNATPATTCNYRSVFLLESCGRSLKNNQSELRTFVSSLSTKSAKRFTCDERRETELPVGAVKLNSLCDLLQTREK